MTAHGLTLRQVRLLAFIRDYTQKMGYSPGVVEMQRELGLQSKSGVVRLLDALQERGRISRIRGKARSVAVIERDTFMVSPPLDLGERLRSAAAVRGVSPEQMIVNILSAGFAEVSVSREAGSSPTEPASVPTTADAGSFSNRQGASAEA